MSVTYRCLQGEYILGGRVYYGNAHKVSKKGVYSGGMGRLWEDHISK